MQNIIFKYLYSDAQLFRSLVLLGFASYVFIKILNNTLALQVITVRVTVSNRNRIV